MHTAIITETRRVSCTNCQKAGLKQPIWMSHTKYCSTACVMYSDWPTVYNFSYSNISERLVCKICTASFCQPHTEPGKRGSVVEGQFLIILFRIKPNFYKCPEHGAEKICSLSNSNQQTSAMQQRELCLSKHMYTYKIDADNHLYICICRVLSIRMEVVKNYILAKSLRRRTV